MESVDEALRYIAKQFMSVDVARVQWTEERKVFQSQLKELQEQKLSQDEFTKELMLQIKMLEYALVQERGRYVTALAKAEKPPGSPKSRTVFRTSSSNGSFVHGASPKSDSEVSRGLEISRGPPASPEVSVTRGKEGETLISRARVNSRTENRSIPSSPSNPPMTKGPPPVEVLPSAKVSGSFRACKMKQKLSGHLDGVRSICFHPTEPLLVSGSEDATVKIWNLASKNSEVEPMATFRVHTDSVLSVASIKPEHSVNLGNRNGLVASGGKDGTITLLAYPEAGTDRDSKSEPYAYEEYYGYMVHRLEAHRDAIWSLAAHPYTNLLFSASADACVRVWGISAEPTLKCTLGASIRQHPAGIGHNLDGLLVPTCVAAVPTNAATLIAGYTSCTIGQYDIGSERLLQLMCPADSDVHITAFREAQVNQVVAHPTMPIVVAAHQDRRLRFYDLRAGKCVASVVAHQDAVSSLSLDAAGLYLASGGHDGSLRFWSVADRTCVHEQSAHRPKYGEAVQDVAYHPTRGFVATGGADSVIKVFQ
ncbi:striatin-3 family protein [Achlya hypogyna]|uniref:Striatin-3 family protein n=1 Tax=Achlya hypogyna TaxID=1202772 RepID=A0A1V9YR51_ACHHY|nr:striatin-3 family protein [Achlya hypogyna]